MVNPTAPAPTASAAKPSITLRKTGGEESGGACGGTFFLADALAHTEGKRDFRGEIGEGSAAEGAGEFAGLLKGGEIAADGSGAGVEGSGEFLNGNGAVFAEHADDIALTIQLEHEEESFR